ncbi:MAG: O-antigen ligase family protein [Synergistaceae bacterium]|nr:O-antigen ligase family protein [Synergistaceae bacterium]
MAFFAASALTALPVLVFNVRGYPFLDFYKWAVTFPLVAYGVGTASFMFLAEKPGVRVTPIELTWLAFVLLMAFQPFILPLLNFHEWLRNAYFFAALGGAVFVLRNLPVDEAFPWILRSVCVAGGISSVFGFAQNMAGVKFPFILGVPSGLVRFFANTGLDNLLGAYLALAVTAGVWLLIYGKRRAWNIFDFSLLALNTAGMWRTGTRSAYIACAVGCAVLLAFSRSRPGFMKKCLKTLASVAVILVCVALASPGALRVERRDMGKLFDLSTSREGRWTIWLTSWEMIKTAPLLGVGLGNYKWNYMDAMAAATETYNLPPRYTHWAHNEYIQWIAETGAVGGILFFSFLLYCIFLCLKGIKKEENAEKKPLLVWSLAALAVLMADSCFSRPMHHADTAFTLSLALAVISRIEAVPVNFSSRARWAAGGVMLAISLSGLIFFVQSFQGRNFLGAYMDNQFYLTLSSSEVREGYKHPLLLRDAYLRLIARENYARASIGFDDTAEQDYRDAVRLLTRCFETQPMYKELNMLMMLYQKRGEFDEGRRYFKYYPPEEREKFLEARFEGKYMQ